MRNVSSEIGPDEKNNWDSYEIGQDYEFIDCEDLKLERSLKWRSRARRFMGTIALSATCIAGAGAYDIQKDTNMGKYEVADSHPSIHEIYKAPPYTQEAKVATVVATGLGTRDSSYTANLLKPFRELGNVYALEYSNRDINIEELVETLKAQVEKDDIKYVVADGFSAGGPILLGVMAELKKELPDIEIVSVILNSSPIGKDSLTRRSNDSVDVLQALLKINPDLMYSRKVRLGAEIVARHYDYTTDEFPYIDIDKFIEKSKSLYQSKYVNPEVASGSLVASQYRFLSAYNVKPSLQDLSDDEGEDGMLVYYTRATRASSDKVVDVDNSEKNLGDLADEYGLEYESIRIDNIGHANPNSRTKEYNSSAKKEIIPIIQSRIAKLELQEYLDSLPVIRDGFPPEDPAHIPEDVATVEPSETPAPAPVVETPDTSF